VNIFYSFILILYFWRRTSTGDAEGHITVIKTLNPGFTYEESIAVFFSRLADNIFLLTTFRKYLCFLIRLMSVGLQIYIVWSVRWRL